ncbi:ammonium transporter [Thiorhodovibrio frisius]|uniref:cyclic-guanylate-specific phosphodiesterase n=1 Tax=Thiorhodovibrio frisius TaxID=631362 RepID=H8YX55_9GAMM|nr:ammonium transporter [Thiorhodovibrio frisius]EIC23031.1 ammonium transporter [Thiorhodovibrio frisius]WPL22704.1 Cyclic di-GMP phosphodiesterase Gmr [Thiorhodovibrio frisius]
MSTEPNFAALDIAWILLCAFLVFLMQGGFLCLESGLVRAKNSINVAVKNLMDLCLSALVYWLFGYALMFGTSLSGLVGSDSFLFDGAGSPWLMSFFFFQAMFCSTAATIVAGAVAERMRFLAYGLTAILLSAFIYPVTGHWAWGGAASGEASGWLAQLGFIDFAGSTVVHSVGGWTALVAVLLLGPRSGRFSEHGIRAIAGGNLPLASLGVILLWFGWFGFNGGSTLGLNADVPLVLFNTFLSGAAGGIGGLIYSYVRRGYPVVLDLQNGVIAGLVGITASCHLQAPAFAALIGLVAGLLAAWGTSWLERRRIDDAVGAIPAHLFAGVWGTLAVALFAPADSFGTTGGRLVQLGVQALGVLSIGAYSFMVSLAALWLINRFYPLRVTFEEERLGLNVAEHGASTEILDLLGEMEQQSRRGDFSHPVSCEPHTEVGQIARQYNHVLARVNDEIHRREQLLHDLAASETRKSAILDAVLDCIITIDGRGQVVEFNPAAERTFGCSRRMALGRQLGEIAIPTDQREAFNAALNAGFSGEGRFVLDRRIQFVLTRVSHESFPAELSITRVRGGPRLEYNFHIRDVTRQREVQQRLHQLAHFDILTGLANRSHFRQQLDYFLLTDPSARVAVLFLDLDRFKQVNDSLGHDVGDQLLRSVAERLRELTRKEDLVSRWGGDEFVIALLGVGGLEDVRNKGSEFIARLAETHRLDNKAVHAPSSIGIARYPEAGETADLLIRNADLALYEAKDAGRNNFQFFTPALAREHAERLDRENSLRDALAQGEFVLFYQPQFDLTSGALIGTEALLRWQHGREGMIQPSVFIPILEESGLIVTVGEWVLRTACRQQAQWQAQGLAIPRVAVNVSGKQFLKPNFAELVASILHEEGLPASSLELEITETVLASNNQMCIDVLRQLKTMGIGIAIDDFGTGYSSLSYLKRFPVDVIKLDRSFVGECDINGEDAAICSAIISLARSLRLGTLAEGVERAEQLDFLRTEGCDSYQGFIAAPPLPVAELIRHLELD